MHGRGQISLWSSLNCRTSIDQLFGLAGIKNRSRSKMIDSDVQIDLPVIFFRRLHRLKNLGLRSMKASIHRSRNDRPSGFLR